MYLSTLGSSQLFKNSSCVFFPCLFFLHCTFSYTTLALVFFHGCEQNIWKDRVYNPRENLTDGKVRNAAGHFLSWLYTPNTSEVFYITIRRSIKNQPNYYPHDTVPIQFSIYCMFWKIISTRIGNPNAPFLLMKGK